MLHVELAPSQQLIYPGSDVFMLFKSLLCEEVLFLSKIVFSLFKGIGCSSFVFISSLMVYLKDRRVIILINDIKGYWAPVYFEFVTTTRHVCFVFLYTLGSDNHDIWHYVYQVGCRYFRYLALLF